MAYCGPKGIPYTWFTGQSDRNRWDTLSTAAAIAWQSRENDRCNGCGQFRSEWYDAEGKELRDIPFELRNDRCPGCEMVAMWRDEEGPRAGHGVSPVFVPAEVYEEPSLASSPDGDE